MIKKNNDKFILYENQKITIHDVTYFTEITFNEYCNNSYIFKDSNKYENIYGKFILNIMCGTKFVDIPNNILNLIFESEKPFLIHYYLKEKLTLDDLIWFYLRFKDDKKIFHLT